MEEVQLQTSLTTLSECGSKQVTAQILRSRYLLRDDNGKVVETPDELWRRVARSVASAERAYGGEAAQRRWEETFHELMAEGLFLPNSPCLMNAGTKLAQLAACFVLPIEDSLEGIFASLGEAALIHKSGGGTGFSFSQLRAKGDPVGSTSGVASGPVSFMRVYSAATEEIKQGGRRRGANMAVLRVDHPDIEEFIKCKLKEGQLSAFNLSVGITDKFMDAMCKGKSYSVIDPRTGKAVGQQDARGIWGLICECAWACGDPGILFIDTVNAANPTPQLGLIHATNPCGEQPLLPYESCNLGSINLTKMVRDTETDWDRLRATAAIAVRFLDDVIDGTRYPLNKIERVSKGNRKIGLGVMGFADMLYLLGIPYDSDEAVEFGEKLMREISSAAREASEELAAEKGPFPDFSGSIYDKDGKPAIRNATRTTIAPTGTISLIAGVSSGIEPNFALAYHRKIDGHDVLIANPVFEQVTREHNFYRPQLINEVLRKGTLRGIDDIPEETKSVFVTAPEIAPEWHVRMQAAFQEHTDNAVSKTVNLPRNSTVSVVSDVFVAAWQLKCKGITVYRDGSKSGQVIRAGNPATAYVQPRERPEQTTGITRKVKVGCGNLYVTVNRDDLGACEVFTNVGRAGGCPSQAEATSRLASIALRAGVAPEAIVEQLRGIRCFSTIRAQRKGEKVEVLSCPDAIGRAMGEFLSNGDDESDDVISNQCPACGNSLEQEGGRCVICRSCGFSRCL